jgi:lipopolysaccharide transport system ATP-binding protein
MSDVAVRVSRLGKRYRIGRRERYGSLRDTLMRGLAVPFRRLRSRAAAGGEDGDLFWALHDISFEVGRGEVIGVIGRNGAGKSTLLKIISRVTEPTTGEIALRGRVGSLLEVGTGFHPELTGRENVYLNGAILGMKRREIARRFDEIVAFAGVEPFLDTPAKHYSTGMYMRLAFAVAAHLQADVLLIDEVLAVGDAQFQEKCLGKMAEVATQGRTVLFVSHQLNAVQTLCTRALLLAEGRLTDQGEPKAVIARYLARGGLAAEWSCPAGDSPARNPYFNPTRLAVVDADMQVLDGPASADAAVGVLLEGDLRERNGSLAVGFAVTAATGELLFWSLSTDQPAERWPELHVGKNRLVAWIPPHLLNEGDYRIEMIVALHFTQWFSQPGVTAPSVSLTIKGGLSESPFWMMARPGLNAPVIPFRLVE